jgi:hypothetical protein
LSRRKRKRERDRERERQREREREGVVSKEIQGVHKVLFRV